MKGPVNVPGKREVVPPELGGTGQTAVDEAPEENSPRMAKSGGIFKALAEKADRVSTVFAELTPEGWSQDLPPVQTVAVEGLTEDRDGAAGVAAAATQEQREAARKAKLAVQGQTAEGLTIAADGVTPAVGIPLQITLF